MGKMSQSLDDYRMRNEDAPLELLRESAEWKPVIRLIDAWATERGIVIDQP